MTRQHLYALAIAGFVGALIRPVIWSLYLRTVERPLIEIMKRRRERKYHRLLERRKKRGHD